MSRIRRYFFVGLIVLAPAGLTAVVLAWIFRQIDDILGEPIEVALGFRIPGLGFLVLGAIIITLGWAVHQAVGRRVLSWWNRALVRFPVTGHLYNAASQIVQSVVSEKRRVFTRTVLIPYPTDGLWAIAFVTAEESPLMSRLVGQPCTHVFVPTTPNPTSGFLLIVPRDRAIPTGLSVEDAMQLVISAGSLSPPDGEEGAARRGLDIDTLFHEPSGA